MKGVKASVPASLPLSGDMLMGRVRLKLFEENDKTRILTERAEIL